MALIEILEDAFNRKGASDIHITLDKPGIVRDKGQLIKLEQYGAVAQEEIDEFVHEYMEFIADEYDKLRDGVRLLGIDHAVEYLDHRMRVNIYKGMSGMCMALRILSSTILTPEQLKLPAGAMRFTQMKDGLVLVVGTTGSGKSTTLAGLLDHINETREENIITLEDPIEYVYTEKKCRIEQREIGEHCDSFAAGVKEAMRQDPDIVLVGEMRDIETIHNAITLAETGHLVFATLHAKSCTDTVDRIIDVFPAGQQDQIRTQVASVLKGVLNQKLIRALDGGRVPLVEIMMIDDTIAGMIKAKRPSNSFRDMIRSSAHMGSVHLVDNAIWHIRERRINVDSVKPYLSDDDMSLLHSILDNGGGRKDANVNNMGAGMSGGRNMGFGGMARNQRQPQQGGYSPAGMGIPQPKRNDNDMYE